MVVRCCIPSCKRRTRRGIRVRETGVSFHQFPSDSKLFQEWIKALNCEGFTPNFDCHRVCSDHFKQTDYIDGKRHRCLKRAAVPSIFNRSYEDSPANEASCSDHPELRKERGKRKDRGPCGMSHTTKAAAWHVLQQPCATISVTVRRCSLPFSGGRVLRGSVRESTGFIE